MITAIENYILRRIYIRIQRLTSQNQRDQYAIRGDPDAGLRGAITSTVSIADDNIYEHIERGEDIADNIYEDIARGEDKGDQRQLSNDSSPARANGPENRHMSDGDGVCVGDGIFLRLSFSFNSNKLAPLN